jgi:uncharacterized membrane protein
MNPPPPAPHLLSRLDRLDALRGLAIVWMASFHFCFDLNHFGWLVPRQNFYVDPFWTGQRTAIVSVFLFTAGLSLAVALHGGQRWSAFWRRWAQIAACALLVSIGSMWMFPRSWIAFGVLHGIAVMLVLARLAAGSARHSPAPLWLAGAAALLAPQFIQASIFDSPWLNWTGLVTRLPITEDYVPVLPWLGVMLWGVAAGRTLLARDGGVLAGALPQALQPLALLGRWSLSFYMLHQPVFIGALMAVQALRA